MSWKSEIVNAPQILYHAYNRGVNRGQLFFRDADYEYFISCIADALRNASCSLLSFTLMPNHYHLVLDQASPLAGSTVIQIACQKYALYLNRIRQRSGPLFSGRYRAEAIYDEAGLLRLTHYVHTNPVSAGLVPSPEAWRFSSHKNYLSGKGGIVVVENIFEILGGPEQFVRFFKEYDPADPESAWDFVVKRNFH
jgi:putative transposase